ncbi:MAG TPA: glycosyltransferase [Saprospiraceae bacterium]|nr:glycosyltransferase [Saprospiraceae bacterium]
MYNTFVSIVCVVNSSLDLQKIKTYFEDIHPICENAFSDYEYIIVNNVPNLDLTEEISGLPDTIKRSIYLISLSNRVDKNNALLAALDRSNGDYTIIFDWEHAKKPELIKDLFEKTRAGNDIVYLRAPQKSIKLRFRLFYAIFHFIIRHFSKLKIDENAFDTRIISRRALNSLLRLRENLRYMKAIYSLVGYRTSYIEVEGAVLREEDSFRERFNTSLVAVTSFTTFLRSLLLWIFIFSFIFLIGVVGNALKVKFTGVDIFGNVGEALGGWTFLVVLISVFFAITFLNLYIMSIYRSNIYNEIKQRPLYLI